MKEVRLSIPDSKFNFFLELIKNLDFEVKTEVVSTNFPTLSEKQIIDQAIAAEKEIESGKFVSHEHVLQEF